LTYKFMEKRSEKDRVRARVSSIYIVFYFRYEKRGIRRGFIPSCMAGLCMVQWRLTGYVPIALCRTVRKLMPSDSVTNDKPGQLPEQQAYNQYIQHVYKL